MYIYVHDQLCEDGGVNFSIYMRGGKGPENYFYLTNTSRRIHIAIVFARKRDGNYFHSERAMCAALNSGLRAKKTLQIIYKK